MAAVSTQIRVFDMAAMPQPISCGVCVPVLEMQQLDLEYPCKLEQLRSLFAGVRAIRTRNVEFVV